MMKHDGIWDKFDDNGDFTGDGDMSDTGQEYHKFKAKLDQVIKSLHGNYDPDAPISIKGTWKGRALTQFRTWMFESFENRFGEEKFDEVLGRTTKGRYRNYAKMENLMVFPALYDFYKASTGKIENETDAANLRKNAVELVTLLGLMAVMLMIKGGDDEKNNMYTNLLINQLNRLQSDVTFYTNPMSFESLTKQAVPAMSIVTDSYQLIGASFKAITGDDEIGSGTFSGDSRLARESMQMFPLINQAPRIKSVTSQVFKN